MTSLRRDGSTNSPACSDLGYLAARDLLVRDHLAHGRPKDAAHELLRVPEEDDGTAISRAAHVLNAAGLGIEAVEFLISALRDDSTEPEATIESFGRHSRLVASVRRGPADPRHSLG